MKKLLTTSILCIVLAHLFGQTERKVSVYLQGQFNKTLYDRTKGNNPSGIGAGLQVFLNSNSQFKPTVDFTADAYLIGTKDLYLHPDGTPIDAVDKMTNLFAGLSYHPLNELYVSFVAGPSFANEQALWGIKPSLGFYLTENKGWTLKASYTNIFNREQLTKEDFGAASLSIGLRLF